MDYARAKEIGDEAEKQVADFLDLLAAKHGFRMQNDCLVLHASITAQIDHVVIDRYGILVVETKAWNARVRGTYADKKWTACYPSGDRKQFQSPIAQNQQHENVLRQALNANGYQLEPDYVRGVVVFVGTDLSALELDSISRQRVKAIADLPAFFEDRYAFPPNNGVSEIEIQALAESIRTLNRSQDTAALAIHVERADWVRRDRRDQRSRRGDGAPIALPSAPKQGPGGGHAQAFLKLVVQFGVLGLLLMLALYVAPPLFDLLVLRPVESATLEPLPRPTPTLSALTIADAERRLSEFDPRLYSKVSNLGSPKVESADGVTKFTWTYVSASGNAARVRYYTLGFDSAGNVVHVDSR